MNIDYNVLAIIKSTFENRSVRTQAGVVSVVGAVPAGILTNHFLGSHEPIGRDVYKR